MAESRRAEPAEYPVRNREWVTGQIATGRRFIPDVPVVTHRGDNKLFYSDLVKDRTVLVQFMSIAHHARYPATRNLVRVQQLLRGRLGRDVFLYSITADPENDTSQALAHFARRHAAGPGWLFLTGDAAALSALKGAFYVHTGGESHDHARHHPLADAGGEPGKDCSMGLMRYGNDAMGLWGSVPTKTDPAMIVERLSWILPRRGPQADGGLKRGGPLVSAAHTFRKATGVGAGKSTGAT